ncbi:MAG: site-specific integrase [Pseudomonadota bacterium]
MAGRGPDVIALQAKLKQISEHRGFGYMPAADLALAPLQQILERTRVVADEPASGRAALGDALFGAVDVGGLDVSGLFDHYKDLTQDRRRDMSDDQFRRWSNARTKAVGNWISAVGDVRVDAITRAQVLKFRAWWWGRVASGSVKAATANKDFSHLGAMLQVVLDLEGIEARNPFHGVRFEDDTDTGVPFSRAWIRDTLLAPGALDVLNDQARDVLLAFVNTGARPSELVDLRRDTIMLGHNIPHIIIAPDKGRRLKTRHSARLVPLVGVSLEAMRRHPDGFPRYRGRATSWSNLVVPYLREHDLLELEGQSAYSLRHSFSDALQNQNCPDRTRKELMGHALEGINYGDGASLATKLEWVQKVAF